MATARLFLVASACFWDGSARTRCDTHAGMLYFVRFARRADREAASVPFGCVRKKCRVPRVQNSGVVSSLKVIVGVLETL